MSLADDLHLPQDGLSPPRLCSFLLLTLGCAPLTGCSTLGVNPWEHDILSRSDMRPDGGGLDEAIDEHLYFSKEASSGGRSFGGGGCGCN